MEKFVSLTMGKIDSSVSIGLVLWARRPLGRGHLLNIMLSKIISGQKPFVLVDDLLPRALFDRSIEEQEIISNKYKEFIFNADCKASFTSQLYQSNYFLRQIIYMLKNITYNEFIRCLPMTKKNSEIFEKLSISEVLHTASELFLFEEIKKFGVDTVIIPEFSQAIIALHRNISQNPLKGIITPTFGSSSEIEKDIIDMKELLKCGVL